ncbi:MAG TPA: serine hydrolase domain-containing protein [Thermoanaerobaculia bacterium]|nr:serine hydrolase domain-containing protein [Thermoanaerobaculia bacterium]
MRLTANREIARFERDADEIRRELRIPGMSAVIVQNQKILWTRGFGYADLENRVPATPDTLYHVASVTKTFGLTLVLQLLEKGQLTLDEPIARSTRRQSTQRRSPTSACRFATSSATPPKAHRAIDSRTTAISMTRSRRSSKRNMARRSAR